MPARVPSARPSLRRRSSAERTLHAIVRVAGVVRRLGEERMSRFGITPAQWGILRTLHRRHAAHQPAPRMAELGAELLVRPPGLSGAVERMVQRGLVQRAADAVDHRSRRIALTAEGLALVKTVLADHRTWQQAMMGGLSAAQQRILSSHLEMLFERLMGRGDDTARAGPRAQRRSARERRSRA